MLFELCNNPNNENEQCHCGDIPNLGRQPYKSIRD